MKTIRIISFTIALALLLSTVTLAAIREPDAQPNYTYVSGVSANLSISGGTAKVTSRITPQGSRKTTLTARLQQKVGGKWKTIATWTDSNDSGTSEAGGSKSVSSGYSYRAYVTGRVYDASGKVLETVDKASATRTS